MDTTLLRDKHALQQASQKLRLGEILLATGTISEAQLEQALARKRDSGRRIGEELVASGHTTNAVVAHALALQRRLFLAASLAALSPINTLTVPDAVAGEARAQLTVTAVVVDSFTVRSVHQASALVITPQDIQRGYVDAPAASRFEVRNSRPCLFEFRAALKNIFRSVRVTGTSGAAEFGADGGTLLQTGFRNGAASVDVAYRFNLAPDVTPGTYAWPLSLTVLPL